MNVIVPMFVMVCRFLSKFLPTLTSYSAAVHEGILIRTEGIDIFLVSFLIEVT